MSTLRERIAALQQRSSSPSANAQATSAKHLGVGSEGKSLKDKIANFEKRGGTPIPRSSFGLAPPSKDKPTSREMYGNRFVGTPMPADTLVSRSNSARSISPVPNVKRERRVSSYGDGGWSSQIQHQRSYSTADKLIPMHTGTTSSDEVSSMSSSFPATPRDTGGTFLRMSEAFKEDPEDYDESASSVLGDNSSPTRGLSSANPEVFRQAYDKFSQISLSGNSPVSTRERKLSSLASPTTPEPEPSLPDIVVNENTGNSGSSTTTASPETVRGTPKTATEPPSSSTRTGLPVVKEPGRKAKTSSSDGGFGYAIVHGRSSAPDRSPSPGSSTAEVKAPKIITTPDDLPSPPISPSTLLKVKQSQQSIRQLSLKPPERPISIGLSTPEIMDRFPPVPSSPSANQQSAAKITSSKSNSTNPTNPVTASTTTSALTPATNPTAPPPPQPTKKPIPKSSIPGWWDYNSDDEDVGGWATVVVATKNSY